MEYQRRTDECAVEMQGESRARESEPGSWGLDPVLDDGCGTVMYHAIAESKERAIELAMEAGYDIEGLEVELEREDVRDMLRRPYPESITDAQVR